ncbi:hypothetical protein GCM10010149_70010 [Nonomuraea roseoviolacea subsp. roseoviolacea]
MQVTHGFILSCPVRTDGLTADVAPTQRRSRMSYVTAAAAACVGVAVTTPGVAAVAPPLIPEG